MRTYYRTKGLVKRCITSKWDYGIKEQRRKKGATTSLQDGGGQKALRWRMLCGLSDLY